MSSSVVFKNFSSIKNGKNILQCFKGSKRGMSDVKPSEAGLKITEPGSAPYVSPTSKLGDVHKVDRLERYFLVWTKKFKSVKDVPAYVSRDVMEKSRNIMRIRLNLSIIGLVFIGSLLAAKSGKEAALRGESVTKNNLDWHKEYNKESKPN